MLVTKVNHVSGLVLRLRKVPNLKVFILIDGKELTQSSGESWLIISVILCCLVVIISFQFFVNIILSVLVL